MKNLRISGMQCELKIPDGFDKPFVKSAMQEALEIVEKKLPLDSTIRYKYIQLWLIPVLEMEPDTVPPSPLIVTASP